MAIVVEVLNYAKRFLVIFNILKIFHFYLYLFGHCIFLFANIMITMIINYFD